MPIHISKSDSKHVFIVEEMMIGHMYIGKNISGRKGISKILLHRKEQHRTTAQISMSTMEKQHELMLKRKCS